MNLSLPAKDHANCRRQQRKRAICKITTRQEENRRQKKVISCVCHSEKCRNTIPLVETKYGAKTAQH